MIALLEGLLVTKDLDRIEVLTSGGVGYELMIPLSAYESLPRAGEQVRLHTHLVVKEDGWQLFGFTEPHERRVFQRLLTANGVGPALALGMLSTLSATRVVQAIRDRDLVTLQHVPRVGKRKAERLILDLAEKMDDLAGGTAAARRPEGAAAEDAVRALAALGYAQPDAERAVRAALDESGGGLATAELIRAALGKVK